MGGGSTCPMSHNSGHQDPGLGELTRLAWGLGGQFSWLQVCINGRWQRQHLSPRRPSFLQVASRSKWPWSEDAEANGQGWTCAEAEGLPAATHHPLCYTASHHKMFAFTVKCLLIHLFSKYLLRGYQGPGTASCPGDTASSWTNEIQTLRELAGWWTGLESVNLSI